MSRPLFEEALCYVANGVFGFQTHDYKIQHEKLSSSAGGLFSFVYSKYLPVFLRGMGLAKEAHLVVKKGDLLYFEPKNSNKGFSISTNFSAQSVLLDLRKGAAFGDPLVASTIESIIEAAHSLRLLDAAINPDDPNQPSAEAIKNYNDCLYFCFRCLNLTLGSGDYPEIMLEVTREMVEYSRELGFTVYSREYSPQQEQVINLNCAPYLEPLVEWSGINIDLSHCQVTCWDASFILAEFAILLTRIGLVTISGAKEWWVPISEVTLAPFFTPHQAAGVSKDFGSTIYTKVSTAARDSSMLFYELSTIEANQTRNSWARSAEWRSLDKDKNIHQSDMADHLAKAVFRAVGSAGESFSLPRLSVTIVEICDLLVASGVSENWLQSEIIRMLIVDFSGVTSEL